MKLTVGRMLVLIGVLLLVIAAECHGKTKIKDVKNHQIGEKVKIAGWVADRTDDEERWMFLVCDDAAKRKHCVNVSVPKLGIKSAWIVPGQGDHITVEGRRVR